MAGFGGVKFKNKKGNTVVLLNPSEKAGKFAAELRTGMRFTNSGQYKPDKNGDIGLTREGRAYRSGYLDARKDGAKVYRYNQRKKVIIKKLENQ